MTTDWRETTATPIAADEVDDATVAVLADELTVIWLQVEAQGR